MKPGVRLLMFVAASVAATVAGWVVFNTSLFHPGLTVLDAARVDARSGDGLALVTEKVGFFATSAQPVEVRLTSADAVIEAAGADPPLVLSGSGGRTVITGLDVQRLGTRLLVLQEIVPLDIRVRVSVYGSRLAALVTNGDRRLLKGCFIVRAGRAYALGDVGSGATVRHEFDRGEGVTPLEQGTWFRGADDRQAGLWKPEAEGAGTAADAERTGAPSLLVAWLDAPVIPLSVPGGKPLGGRPGLSLLRVEAE